MSTEKKNSAVEEVVCRWDGNSRVPQLSSKAAGRLKRVCVMLNVAGVGR